MQRQKRSLQVERYLCHRLFNRCYRPFLSQELTSVRLSPLLSPPWGNADLSSEAGRAKRRINVCVCLCVCVACVREWQKGEWDGLQHVWRQEGSSWGIYRYPLISKGGNGESLNTKCPCRYIYVSIIRCRGTNVCKGCFSSLTLH